MDRVVVWVSVWVEVCPSLVSGHHLWSTVFGSNWHVDKSAFHVTGLLRGKKNARFHLQSVSDIIT